MNVKYPDECPVFQWAGHHFVGSPAFGYHERSDSVVDLNPGWFSLLDADGWVVTCIALDCDGLPVPLTPSASVLLANAILANAMGVDDDDEQAGGGES